MADRLAVLTTGRQDWGLLRPLCTRMLEQPGMTLDLLAGGMALDPEYGAVVESIREQGFEVRAELRWNVRTASPWEQGAEATRATGEVLDRLRPEGLVLLGDRFETAAAALAATVTRTPIAHLYGGEETIGAIDNALRHAITKLSHLHLVAHETYARRILQMGESPESVHVVGSLGVENALAAPSLALEEMERRLGHPLTPPIGLVTVHPTTLAPECDDGTVDAVIEAIRSVDITWVITLPNADPGHQSIRERLVACAEDRPRVISTSALGEDLYLALMKHSALVLGNSSSGMTEAPAMGVPTVNIGIRQAGRIRFPSIVDASADARAVVEAVNAAVARRGAGKSLRSRSLGDDGVSLRIAKRLRMWRPTATKTFRDIGLSPVFRAGDARP